jgi:hypothetical protein
VEATVALTSDFAGVSAKGDDKDLKAREQIRSEYSVMIKYIPDSFGIRRTAGLPHVLRLKQWSENFRRGN